MKRKLLFFLLVLSLVFVTASALAACEKKAENENEKTPASAVDSADGGTSQSLPINSSSQAVSQSGTQADEGDSQSAIDSGDQSIIDSDSQGSTDSGTQSGDVSESTPHEHDYRFVEFVWAEDFSAQVKYVCDTDNETVYYDAVVNSKVSTEPLCETDGLRTYTATYGEFSDEKTETIPALGHESELGVCKLCGKTFETEGLEFALNEGGESYSVTGIGTAAERYLIIPSSYDGKPVTGIVDEAFIDCYDIVKIIIPESITSIGEDAFWGCGKLVEVYNKSSLAITEGSDENGYVGYYVKDIYTGPYESKLSFDENGFIIYTDDDVVSLIGYTGNEAELVLPDYINEINQCAFYENDTLTSITIPDSIAAIGDDAFRGCRIESATIPAFACSSVKNNDLKTVVITSGETIKDSAFSYCTALTSVTIPASVTTIEDDAFYYCTGLESAYYDGDIEGWCNICFVKDDSTPLKYATSLYFKIDGEYTLVTEVVIPDGVTALRDYLFYKYDNLTKIRISANVTRIGNYAFYDCDNLAEITFDGTIAQWQSVYKSYGWNTNVPATTVSCSDGVTNL